MFSREAIERARVQAGYNDLVGRVSRERAACEAQAKDEATRRAVERALGAALADALRAYPDVFATTRLSAATVDEFAASFTALII